MLFWVLACNTDGEMAQIDKIMEPTTEPTSNPSTEPSIAPATEPTNDPTSEPTSEPSVTPTSEPTEEPSLEPIDDDIFSYVSMMVQPVNGFIDVPVPVTDQATTAMVSVRGTDETVIYEVLDPSGEAVFQSNSWYGISQTLTDAIYTSQSGERVMNWPVRSSDTPLRAGEWTFTFFTNEVSAGTANVDIMIKRDTQLNSGTLRATIAHTTELNYDQDFDFVLEQGIEIWADIFAQAGITIEVDILASSLSGDIPSPFQGSIDYYSLNAQGDNQDILIVIGEDIAGVSDQFGLAGSIPGTTGRHKIGAVALSWLYAAGPDGTFDSVDIRLLGETLAHEVGHYIGLPHPVEHSWAQYDALSDTTACTDESSCESIFQNNVMFPYPICDAETCVEQTDMTVEQRGVAHRYIGVD